MLTLTVLQRQNLKARAHPLKPTVLIGTAGLTPSVLAEAGRALKSRELIKIRADADREVRAAMLEQLCTELHAAPVQHIGKILVIYRPQEDLPEVKATRRKRKPLTKKQLGNSSR